MWREQHQKWKQNERNEKEEEEEITVHTINLLWLLQISPLIQMKMLYYAKPHDVWATFRIAFIAIDRRIRIYTWFFSIALSICVSAHTLREGKSLQSGRKKYDFWYFLGRSSRFGWADPNVEFVQAPNSGYVCMQIYRNMSEEAISLT